jgi:hypothetical protein
MMEWLRKLPLEERKRLNKLYREGAISRKQLMRKMKNGLFDHDRLAVKDKFMKCIKRHDLENGPDL